MDNEGKGVETAVAFLNKDGGYIQIGHPWFTAYYDENLLSYILMPDTPESDKNAVWAGSAEMLIRAAKYIISAKSPSIPFAANVSWKECKLLGNLPGKHICHLCITATRS